MAPIPRTGTSKPAKDSKEDKMHSRIAFLALRQPLKEKKTDVWVTSVRCNGHITNDIKWYIEYTKFPTPRIINRHTSQPILAYGTGTILLPALRPEGRTHMEIQAVWFTPTALCNMLSMTQLKEQGLVYDWRISSFMSIKSKIIVNSAVSWNCLNTIKLDME